MKLRRREFCPIHRSLYCCGREPIRNVWSAAVLQAKNAMTESVCANVSGLCWSSDLLA
jgi:hypothetical protein